MFKAGKISMDSNVGRSLIKIVDSIPILDAQTFDTLMTNQMNVIILMLKFFKFVKKIYFNLKGFAYGFLFV